MTPINQTPYLRTTRLFPEEAPELVAELDKMYIDMAEVVNKRVIGIYPTNRPAINGKSFFITSSKQQGLQQLYTFTASGNIPHGINLSAISQIMTGYGSFTDGTNYYGAIYGSNVAIAGQVSFYITPTNIVIQSGAGAPAISKGIIVLEWLGNI